MNVSSRGVGKAEILYKNKIYKWFFNIKLAKKIFPKWEKKSKITLITEYKVVGFDIISNTDDEDLYNMLGPEFGVYSIIEEIKNAELEKRNERHKHR